MGLMLGTNRGETIYRLRSDPVSVIGMHWPRYTQDHLVPDRCQLFCSDPTASIAIAAHAPGIDASQYLFLEQVYELLADSGYAPDLDRYREGIEQIMGTVRSQMYASRLGGINRRGTIDGESGVLSAHGSCVPFYVPFFVLELRNVLAVSSFYHVRGRSGSRVNQPKVLIEFDQKDDPNSACVLTTSSLMSVLMENALGGTDTHRVARASYEMLDGHLEEADMIASAVEMLGGCPELVTKLITDKATARRKSA